MLPGFRFLFATVVLAGAVLIFGLGAAALLRAAHEEFASLPSRHTAPPPLPARVAEPAPPTLALLRVETPEVAPDIAMKNATPIALPDKRSATAESAAVTPETTAAAKPEEIVATPAASGIAAVTPAILETPPQPVPTQATAPDAVQRFDMATNPAAEAEPKPATIASLPAPAEANPAVRPDKPAAAKARQAAARAAARRRLVIARARAAARARAIEQQKQKASDPLSQLFGGG